MFKLKQYNYILLLGFFFLQQSICSACNVTFSIEKKSPSCFGDTNGKIEITVIDGTPPFVFSFDGGATFSTENLLENIAPGSYEVVVQDSEECEHSEMVTLNEPANLQIDLGADLKIGLGEDVNIFAQLSGLYDVLEWNSSNPNSTAEFLNEPYLNFYPLVSQTIYLTATVNGCYFVDSIFIEVEKLDNIFIPNVFSPNGDGYNDIFTPFIGSSILKIRTFQVTNIWGEIVFEAKDFIPDHGQGWNGSFDGKNASPGVFMYCVDVEYLDGETKIFCGDVLLIRSF